MNKGVDQEEYNISLIRESMVGENR